MAESSVENTQSEADERADPAVLAAENAALRDRLLRALAETENTRRQADRARTDARQYAIADFARELLGVSDNLQRAIAASAEHPPQTVEGAALMEGVRATERMLNQIFERFGVRRIPTEDAAFDPNLHEAVMQVSDETRPSDSVVQNLEEGYTIRDRLLRPARVVVSKRQPDSPPSEMESPDIVPNEEGPDRQR
jgi:molecular chaperone GrpE